MGELNDFEQEFQNEQTERELHEAELEISMRAAFQFIEEYGAQNWLDDRKHQKSSNKRTILDNMINWFANEEREEYEKCAKLQKLVDKLNIENK